MNGERLSIQPVWGTGGRKLSYGVLDTAETLLDSIDDLAEVLDRLTMKYTAVEEDVVIEEKQNEADYDEGDLGINVIPPSPPKTTPAQEEPKPTGSRRRTSADFSMFRKLKSCLDSTRHLIGSLRSEKGRLMKRQLSVECRMSELEDYKKHMKQDLNSLNDLVDLLTERICRQEVTIADALEAREQLHAERDDLQARLETAEALCTELSEDNENLMKENHQLKDHYGDTNFRLRNQELKYENEVLSVENVKLKELVRDLTESNIVQTGSTKSSGKELQLSVTSLPDVVRGQGKVKTISVSEDVETGYLSASF
ncbi:paramyosin-like [Dreissena polymorpha]|uniref:Uncharacterized protein n=1 Tax=Dreissena polymorpha TaxID=45954 RepID=A0A9D4R9M1_DREPO|nr:paramyosin-like [Dreissena polymorpha]XP_052270737.1 paramyosin-like [Dreissena polymorpha]KAH3858707.1 hypothetical protein DPMN_101333 [Dreissena polymorpha]